MKSIAILSLIILISFTYADIPPIANQLFPDAVGSLGYPVEAHYITTEDGYINTYFRIQAVNTTIKSGLPVVFMQHGLLCSGDDWIVNNESLASGFIIANSGYDVWVGNSRGNRYSLGHVSYNSSNNTSPYWDFSWQEMSLYDIPAAFQYINNVTGQTISYIGHSQGSVQMFAALARQDPIVTPLLKHYIAVGPVAYVNHCTSPVVKLATKTKVGNIILRDGNKFLFVDQLQRDGMEAICEDDDDFCIDFMKEIAEADPAVDNMARMDVFVGHDPAGTSFQNMDYWNQMSVNPNFQMYDYGTQGNLLHYNQSTPPLINLSNIVVPVHLFAGYYDELADPQDVEELKSQLTGSPNVTYNTYPYGHLSYMWGLDTDWLTAAFSILEGSDNQLIVA